MLNEKPMNIKTYILYKTIRPTTGQYYIGVHTTCQQRL